MDTSKPLGGESNQGYNDLASADLQTEPTPSSPAPTLQVEEWKPKTTVSDLVDDDDLLWTDTLGLGTALLASTFFLRGHFAARTLRRARVTIGCGTALITTRIAVVQRVKSQMEKVKADPDRRYVWGAALEGTTSAGRDMMRAINKYRTWDSPQEVKDAERELVSSYKQARSAALEGRGFRDRFYAARVEASSSLLTRAICHQILVLGSEESGIRPSPHDMLICSTQAAHFFHSRVLAFEPFATWGNYVCWAALIAECVVRNVSILRYTGRIGIGALVISLVADPLATYSLLEHGMSVQDPKTLADMMRYTARLANRVDELQ